MLLTDNRCKKEISELFIWCNSKLLLYVNPTGLFNECPFVVGLAIYAPMANGISKTIISMFIIFLILNNPIIKKTKSKANPIKPSKNIKNNITKSYKKPH